MNSLDYIVYGIFIIGGLFSVLAASLDFDWFFDHRKAHTFVSWFGRTGARIFYGILGLALIICGVLALLGYMEH